MELTIKNIVTVAIIAVVAVAVIKRLGIVNKVLGL